MKKIINGKVYSTETAKLLGEWDNGYYGNDFKKCQEDLYLTKSGNYFTHGSGGPMSRYAVNHGNQTSCGEAINPISYEQAKQWAEEKLSGDEYEKIFGIADESKVILNIEISALAKQKLDKLKSETNQTLSAIIENLINSL